LVNGDIDVDANALAKILVQLVKIIYLGVGIPVNVLADGKILSIHPENGSRGGVRSDVLSIKIVEKSAGIVAAQIGKEGNGGIES
jgi:hypothetical protein